MYKTYSSGFRGPCPKESAEQMTFFNEIRRRYPDTYGVLAFHARNEGKKTAQQVKVEKAEGMTTGTPDIIIPASITFVCELKRQNMVASSVRKEQKKYLIAAAKLGAFACVCGGWRQAMIAFEEWCKLVEK